MRLVLDTNVVVSGLLWDGAPAQLIEAARVDEAELCTSRVLLTELIRILRRAKFAHILATSGLTLEELVLGYADLAMIVEPSAIPPTVIKDPDDDHVLACALAAPADLIVSGDGHLLELKEYQDIPIVAPAAALKHITAR